MIGKKPGISSVFSPKDPLSVLLSNYLGLHTGPGPQTFKATKMMETMETMGFYMFLPSKYHQIKS